MTNKLLRGAGRPGELELARELTDRERGNTCFVQHEDAGGQCERPAVDPLYGLQFCEIHGQEVRISALSEAAHEAEMFFERFRSSHVPRQSAAIERGLELALNDLNATRPGFGGREYEQALLRAYPIGVVPEKVRVQTREWQLGESPGEPPVFDTLLGMLTTVSRLMRIAFEEGEVWLVEMLELQRESVAAQAAVALKNRLPKWAERNLV